MKPIQQVFALVLEKIYDNKDDMGHSTESDKIKTRLEYQDEDKYKKLEDLRNKEVKELLFDKYLTVTNNMKTMTDKLINVLHINNLLFIINNLLFIINNLLFIINFCIFFL